MSLEFDYHEGIFNNKVQGTDLEDVHISDTEQAQLLHVC